MLIAAVSTTLSIVAAATAKYVATITTTDREQLQLR